MIYIKTNFGWFYTGCETEGQLKISWNRIARAYWDSEIKDFMFPGQINRYRTMGLPPIDPKTKLQMWTLGKDFPLFDETKHWAIVADIKKKLSDIS